MYHKGMRTLEQRERLIHQLLAGSAFAFSLCILPITQHVLLAGRTVAKQQLQAETGTVAGASTDKSIISTAASIASITPAPTQAQCEADRAKGFADLNRFLAGEQAAINRDESQATEPYREALKVLTGNSSQIAQQTAELDNQIEQTSSSYRVKLAEVESAVASQKEALTSRVCPTE